MLRLGHRALFSCSLGSLVLSIYICYPGSITLTLFSCSLGLWCRLYVFHTEEAGAKPAKYFETTELQTLGIPFVIFSTIYIYIYIYIYITCYPGTATVTVTLFSCSLVWVFGRAFNTVLPITCLVQLWLGVGLWSCCQYCFATS